jgi:hypothetical protein
MGRILKKRTDRFRRILGDAFEILDGLFYECVTTRQTQTESVPFKSTTAVFCTNLQRCLSLLNSVPETTEKYREVCDSNTTPGIASPG